MSLNKSEVRFGLEDWKGWHRVFSAHAENSYGCQLSTVNPMVPLAECVHQAEAVLKL